MTTITTRAGKGSALSWNELDDNFTSLSANKVEEVRASVVALHRSPNAIMTVRVYDTRYDLDGGAWVDKCGFASWYNETLNGSWLGPQVSEAAARAVPGAATGSYFQLTTNGKCYRLDAGSGTTETYRGNRAAFPKLVGVVVEATSVTLYDLATAGCPMWLRFAAPSTTAGVIGWAGTGTPALRDADIRDGLLAITGDTQTGLIGVDFIRDDITLGHLSNTVGILYNRRIAERNATTNIVLSTGPGTWTIPAIGSQHVRLVAQTGAARARLGVARPLILTGTQDLVTIRADDSVVSATATQSISSLYAGNLYTTLSTSEALGQCGAFIRTPDKFSAGATRTTVSADLDWALPASTPVIPNSGVTPKRGLYVRTSRAKTVLLKLNELDTTKSLCAGITKHSNTGWVVGNSKRIYLCDNMVGTLEKGANLVPNGGFDTDVSGWSTVVPATVSWDAGMLRLTINAAPSAQSQVYSPYFDTVPGVEYEIRTTILPSSGGTCYISPSPSTVYNNNLVNATTGGVAKVTFVATTTSTRIEAICYGTYILFDNFEVYRRVHDRTRFTAVADFYGTLAGAPAADGAELSVVSGWSATNYLREAYASALDFGTSGFTVSARVRYSANQAGTIIHRGFSSGAYLSLGVDDNGRLVATVSDGTTTRTATSPTVWSLDALVEVNATFDGSTLALYVQRDLVASATGTALSTLANASAVLTIGNNYQLDSAFPGSIGAVKLSASVATASAINDLVVDNDKLYQTNAKCLLPETLDDGIQLGVANGRWAAPTALGGVAIFEALLRTRIILPAAGKPINYAESLSGIGLLGKSTTAPGVDAYLPDRPSAESPYLITKDGVVLNFDPVTFDFDAVTSQVDFYLPPGFATIAATVAGTAKREGPTKDWRRYHDGTQEVIRFAVAPGAGVWVQITAIKDGP